MQIHLRISSCIQSACTVLKISITEALVKPSISSFLQNRWIESFLCWAHCNKYVVDSSSLPFMRRTSVVTFNSFFTSQPGLFSIGCFSVVNSDKPSPSWDRSCGSKWLGWNMNSVSPESKLSLSSYMGDLRHRWDRHLTHTQIIIENWIPG